MKVLLEYEHENVEVLNGDKIFVLMKMGDGFCYRICERGKPNPPWTIAGTSLEDE